MSRAVVFELEVPDSLAKLQLPAAVHDRLISLLDRQDRDGALTAAERQEAEGIADLAELLTVLRMRAGRVGSDLSE